MLQLALWKKPKFISQRLQPVNFALRVARAVCLSWHSTEYTEPTMSHGAWRPSPWIDAPRTAGVNAAIIRLDGWRTVHDTRQVICNLDVALPTKSASFNPRDGDRE
jgi:hypothetical protein